MNLQSIMLDGLSLYQGPPQMLNDFRVNGHQIAQTADILRSSSAKIFGRGNRHLEILWSVNRIHTSLAEAQQFLLLHPTQIPAQGTLALVLSDGSSLSLTDCVVTSVAQELAGLRTTHSYQAVAATLTAGFLPNDNIMYSGTVSLSMNSDTVTVSGLALPSAPRRVWVSVNKPTASASNIFATVRSDSVSQDGFVVNLSAGPESDQFTLNYLYIL